MWLTAFSMRHVAPFCQHKYLRLIRRREVSGDALGPGVAPFCSTNNNEKPLVLIRPRLIVTLHGLLVALRRRVCAPTARATGHTCAHLPPSIKHCSWRQCAAAAFKARAIHSHVEAIRFAFNSSGICGGSGKITTSGTHAMQKRH